MAIQRPNASQLHTVASELGMTLSAADAESFLGLMQGTFDAYDAVEQMPEAVPAPAYSRVAAIAPNAAANPYNAWYVRGTIKGATTGKLAGRTVAIKDNVCVAGWPMMNGASTLEGYVPEADATIVTRLLDAGAEITGKATCEYYCCSGGSHTSHTGPVINPRKPGFNAGGSSSGSAALVAAGEVDMATGGDQGGSIRIPAAYCGIVGLKPTYGLVPYTGVFAVELTLDHVGPLTRTVEDNALMLEVMAGDDGLDPRQYAPQVHDYRGALGAGVKNMKVALLTEGFAHDNSEAGVDDAVHAAARHLESLGAEVSRVSVPLHKAGPAIWTPIFLEGATDLMMKNNAYGTNQRGLFLASLMEAHSVWKSRADELSDTLKLGMLVAQYMSTAYKGRFYGRAQNLNRQLCGAYDEVLNRHDLILLPTTPVAATPLPAPGAGREEVVQRAFEMVANTSPFNATGHPAMSLPCGETSDGRPIGAMLVARHYDEASIYRAASALEEALR